MDRVTELALTAERREELIGLLGDEPRLRLEYPKVAEYFNVAAAMPQPAEAQAVAAFDFDLRFLHFMTGGTAVSANPYWDIVAPSVSLRVGRRVVDGGTAEGSAQLAYAQLILQAAYSYAIPSPETLAWVAGFCDGRPVVEVGAGRGYWAAQLSGAGLAVDAFELEPPDRAENVSFPRIPGQADVWHFVAALDGLRIASRAGCVLFLCWPPGWGNTMASEILDAFEGAGGERLVYVGEPPGGRTGDDAFFDALSARWELSSSDPSFVSWWNLADQAQGWIRIRG
ncbi:hypothetical protein [Actinospica robiniae]|uniref:hypothetical protein n=1 Tax=Actinospica robiniae TaxID=304901 RepID=UPI003CCC2AA0